MSAWIKCSERMPSPVGQTAWKSVEVIVCTACGQVMSMNYESNGYAKTDHGRRNQWKWNNHSSPWTVTHWMPLPYPPSEEKSNA